MKGGRKGKRKTEETRGGEKGVRKSGEKKE